MQITGRGLLVLLFAAPLIGMGTWLPDLQWVGWVYVVLALLALGIDWRRAYGIDRFEVVRWHDNRLSLAANNVIHLDIQNRLGTPATVWVRDEPPDEFEIETRLLECVIPPRQLWQGSYQVRPLRRGNYTFGDVHLRWLGPLGLVKRNGRFAAEKDVKVYPNLLDVRRYDLLLRRNRIQELGLRHTRQFGEGTEFERLREYTPDDEYRRIDWKATARRLRPVTVEYQTERSQNILAVLDIGRMVLSPVDQIAKLDYVINAALLLGYVATGKGDKVGLMTFADEVHQYLRPRQGRGQFYRMLELLYGVEARPVEPDYARAFAYLALKQRKRSLIVIFTDLSGGLSLQSLVANISVLARNSLPLVVTISDPDIVATSQMTPYDSLSAYQRVAAAQLLDERRLTQDLLRRRGVLTLDVPANKLSIAVINRYLELKAKTVL